MDQLTGEEILEVDQLGVVGDDLIGLLLERKTDGYAETGLARCAVMAGVHDSAAGSGDDHPPLALNEFHELHGMPA